ncbi:putative surface protease GP63, partial [Trypanosoma cruzi]
FLDDLLRADGAWASLVIVRAACLRAQDASRVCGVVWKYRWVTIRIQASSTDCEGSRRHCGFFWLCAKSLLDGAFVFNPLQFLWGRWEAECIRTEFICVAAFR